MSAAFRNSKASGYSEYDSVADLENRILLEEILGFMDDDTRRLLFRWVRDDDWEEIAADLGISINTAQHRLRYE
jgi:hypothetical protein